MRIKIKFICLFLCNFAAVKTEKILNFLCRKFKFLRMHNPHNFADGTLQKIAWNRTPRKDKKMHSLNLLLRNELDKIMDMWIVDILIIIKNNVPFLRCKFAFQKQIKKSGKFVSSRGKTVKR